MKITFLGVGSAIATTSYKSSYLINDNLLLDAGPEVPVQLAKLGMHPNSLDGILLTHLHGDHLFGLPMLLAESMLEERAEAQHPLTIYGPTSTEETVRTLLSLAYPATDPTIFLRKAGVEFSIVADGWSSEICGLDFEVVPAVHGQMEAYGYKVSCERTSVYFSGDTEICPAVESAARESDFSIVDCTSIETRLPAHMNLKEDVARLAGFLGPYQFILPSHRSFEQATESDDQILFPQDGEAYMLEQACQPRML